MAPPACGAAQPESSAVIASALAADMPARRVWPINLIDPSPVVGITDPDTINYL
jgi:hypothetical protein